MSETFYGEWFAEVAILDAGFSQRFVITGSDTADGAYDGVPGVGVQVTGDTWTVDLEWNDNAGSGWQPSQVRRSADYTIAGGLIVTLGADDNVLGAGDLDFNDLVVTFRSLDPVVDPPAQDPPLDFTITEKELVPPDPRD